MQYLVMIYADEKAVQGWSKEQGARAMATYNEYTQALKTSSVYVASNRLHPTATATTIRVREGKRSAVDGPYAETKEQLGGYYLIDVPTGEAALDWAARCPGASHGAVEVRPIWTV